MSLGWCIKDLCVSSEEKVNKEVFQCISLELSHTSVKSTAHIKSKDYPLKEKDLGIVILFCVPSNVTYSFLAHFHSTLRRCP